MGSRFRGSSTRESTDLYNSMATVSLSDRRRPEPRRGDWIQAKGPRSKIKLKFYTAPRMRGTEVSGSVNPNAYIGPVHDVDHSDMYTSVQVPHPIDKSLLVWINIWTLRGSDSCPVMFAHVVKDTELASWFRRGFHNVFTC